MAQTYEGICKQMAKKLTLSVDEYKSRRNNLKWCYKCNTWLPQTEFCKDRSRWDGLFSICRRCRSQAKGIKRINLAPSKRRQQKVSSLLNYAIRKGKIIKPSNLPCFYCGKKAVEYHHHLGYSDAHIYDVRATCRKCHINQHWDN